MQFDKENVEAFLKRFYSKQLETFMKPIMIFMLVVGIPTALFGIYNTITMIIMLPVIIAMIIWYIMLKIKKTVPVLISSKFISIAALIFSLSLMIGIYKILSLSTYLSSGYLFCGLLSNLIVAYLVALAILRAIRTGWYKGLDNKPVKPYTALVSSAVGIIIIVNRLWLRDLSQDIHNKIIMTASMLMAFIFIMISVSYYIIYYFASITNFQFKDKPESDSEEKTVENKPVIIKPEKRNPELKKNDHKKSALLRRMLIRRRDERKN